MFMTFNSRNEDAYGPIRQDKRTRIGYGVNDFITLEFEPQQGRVSREAPPVF